jgi:predicted nucleic acid-binding protein
MASKLKTSVKVFIDSSVIYSAAYSPDGTASKLLLGSTALPYSLFLTEFVADEVRRNIKENAPAKAPALEILLNTLPTPLPDPPVQLVLDAARIVHLKDAPIVAGAVAASATHLASYDKPHLLAHAQTIREHFGITVLDPANILAEISKQEAA